MPAHGHYGSTRGVRWDRDLDEFVMRCDDCATKRSTCYWPMTREFWDIHQLQRCRACNLERKRQAARDTLAALTEDQRERHRIQNRAYYHRNKKVMSAKHTLYMRKRREQAKEKAA